MFCFIKVWADRDSNPQYQFLANGYCPLLCDHQPALVCSRDSRIDARLPFSSSSKI